MFFNSLIINRTSMYDARVFAKNHKFCVKFLLILMFYKEKAHNMELYALCIV